MEVPEYKIRELTDFNNVPEDKLLLCLADFAEWLSFVKRIPEDSGLKILGFYWKDDGLCGVHEFELNTVDSDGKLLQTQRFPIDTPPKER